MTDTIILLLTTDMFHINKPDLTIRLEQLQETDENYYMAAKYILKLANKAYDIFIGSEVEEKRHLIKFVLSNVQLKDENIVYELHEPFDLLPKYSDNKLWRYLVDTITNHKIKFSVSLQRVQRIFETLNIDFN